MGIVNELDGEEIPKAWRHLGRDVVLQNREIVLQHMALEKRLADITAELAAIDKVLDSFIDDESDLSTEDAMELIEQRKSISSQLAPILKDIKSIEEDIIKPLDEAWVEDVDSLIEINRTMGSKIEAALETGEKPVFSQEEKVFLNGMRESSPLSYEEKIDVKKIIREHNSNPASPVPPTATTVSPQGIESQPLNRDVDPPVDDELQKLFDDVDDLLDSRPDLSSSASQIKNGFALTSDVEFSHKYDSEIIRDPNIGKIQQAMLNFSDCVKGLDIDLGNTGPNGRGCDNALGPKTTAGIEAIQEYLGLEVTGIADTKFLNTLEAEMVALKYSPEVLGELMAADMSGNFNSGAATTHEPVPLGNDLDNTFTARPI